ncbi:MAG TPA: ABC transporter substrate-binding protein [Gemmatimonadaceae bacterium]
MNPDTNIHEAGRNLWISILATSVAITINHLYTLGLRAFVLGAVLVLGATGTLWWFRGTRSRTALTASLLLSAWVVLGFGLYKGLWLSTLRIFLGTLLASLSTSFPKPVIGTYGFEATGILMFVGGMFVAYHAYLFFSAAIEGTSSVESQRTFLRPSSLAATGLLLLFGSSAAYAVLYRDRFVPPEGGVVKIGVIAPVTGPYSILGNSFVKAVQMAQADLRDTKYRYELRIEDSGQDPAKAAEHVRKVVDGEKVDAVVGAVSLIGQVTKPYATRARIPHECVCTVTSIGDGAYNFTNIPSPAAEAVGWVREAKQRGIGTVAILQQDYPSINNHVKAMKAEARRQGIRITYERRFADTTADFRPIMDSARATHPDVYYVEALEPELDILGQQLLDAKIRNIASVVAPSLSEKPWLFEGAWYTDSNLRDMAFKRRFEEKYPGTQFATHMMPYAYDSFNMIVQAYERGVNPAVYIRNIRSYAGTAGTITKARGSGNFESAPAVWTIRNGKPQLQRESDVALSNKEMKP